MTVYFASSEDIDFALDQALINGSNYDANYSRYSLNTRSLWSITADIETALSTFYVTVQSVMSSGVETNGSASQDVITLSEGVTPVARIKSTSGTWTLQTWNGGWVNRGSAFSSYMQSTVGNKLTLKVVLHAATGEITAWANDVQTATWTGNTIGDTGATGLDKVRFRSPWQNTSGNAYWSEVVIADEQTINMRVATLAPNGAGSNTAWAGTYADVDEQTYDEGDKLQSSTAGQLETMALSNYGGGTTVQIKGVFVSTRAVLDAGGPQNLQHVVRVSTTEYQSSTISVSTVYATYRKSWSTNPLSAADWTIADIDALEAGVKSIA